MAAHQADLEAIFGFKNYFHIEEEELKKCVCTKLEREGKGARLDTVHFPILSH